MRLGLIAGAGALGALARYGIGQLVGERSFPWATLAINVAGAFALGLLLTVALDRSWDRDVVVATSVGFLGAFTTFSTFTWESIGLLRSDRLLAAAGYVGLSVTLGLAAAAVGLRVGEAIAR